MNRMHRYSTCSVISSSVIKTLLLTASMFVAGNAIATWQKAAFAPTGTNASANSVLGNTDTTTSSEIKPESKPESTDKKRDAISESPIVVQPISPVPSQQTIPTVVPVGASQPVHGASARTAIPNSTTPEVDQVLVPPAKGSKEPSHVEATIKIRARIGGHTTEVKSLVVHPTAPSEKKETSEKEETSKSGKPAPGK